MNDPEVSPSPRVRPPALANRPKLGLVPPASELAPDAGSGPPHKLMNAISASGALPMSKPRRSRANFARAPRARDPGPVPREGEAGVARLGMTHRRPTRETPLSTQAMRQLQAMISFIKQEADEKARELMVEAEEEFNIAKLQTVEAEKAKLRCVAGLASRSCTPGGRLTGALS